MDLIPRHDSGKRMAWHSALELSSRTYHIAAPAGEVPLGIANERNPDLEPGAAEAGHTCSKPLQVFTVPAVLSFSSHHQPRWVRPADGGAVIELKVRMSLTPDSFTESTQHCSNEPLQLQFDFMRPGSFAQRPMAAGRS